MHAEICHSLVVACLDLRVRPVVVAILLLEDEKPTGVDYRLECRLGTLSGVMSAVALGKIVKKVHR